MTQKTKLDFLERAVVKKTGWQPKRIIHQVGKRTLTHIWRVVRLLDLFEAEGWKVDVSWIDQAQPSKAELLEMAESANMVTDIEIKWGEIE